MGHHPGGLGGGLCLLDDSHFDGFKHTGISGWQRMEGGEGGEGEI